jgi:hypothetical protein
MHTTLSRRHFLLRTTGIAAAALATSIPLANSVGASAPEGFEPGSNFHVSTASGNGGYLRAEATSNGEVIDLVADGTVGQVLQGPRDAEGYSWYGVEIAGTTGWMASVIMQPGGGHTGTLVQVHDGPLNVRVSPGLNKEIAGTVATWTTGRLTTAMPEEVDGLVWDYAHFYDEGNTFGWVAKDFLTFID